MALIYVVELRPKWAHRVGWKHSLGIWALACLVTHREGIKLRNMKAIWEADLCGYRCGTSGNQIGPPDVLACCEQSLLSCHADLLITPL